MPEPKEIISKTERILNLVSFLLKARQPTQWREIEGKVVGYDEPGLSRKSLERRFERDKQTLKEMGIPIEYVPPGGGMPEGYRIPRELAFMRRIEVKPSEALLLNWIARNVQSRSTSSRALASALRKIQLDNPVAYEEADLHPAIAAVGSTSREREELGTLEVLGDAILRCKTLRFVYYTLGTGERKDRRVDPYGMALDMGAWYLCGRDRDHDGLRVFKVSRIQGKPALASLGTEPDFKIPPGFKATDHIGKRPWHMATEGASTETATLRVHRDIAFLIRDDLGPEARFRNLPSGGLEATVEVRSRRGLLRWIRLYLGRIEIVEPEDLRLEHLDSIRRIRASYR